MITLSESKSYRYEPFGIGVKKEWLYEKGGRPVIYSSDEEYEEKIRDYTNTGCKQILAKQQETNFKWLSITFFAFSMFFLFTFRQSFNTLDVMFWSFALIPIVGFLVISFVFDIILLADKWNENKYKGLGK